MRPFLHSTLVNGRWGDPALLVDAQFEGRALLFDLGELHDLAPRKLLRVEAVCVSHSHMDHFIGFDRLLRLLIGREKTVALVGPAGFAERVRHRLCAYDWDLVEGYACDLVLAVTELHPGGALRRTRFRLKSGFAPEPKDDGAAAEDGTVLRGPGFRVRAAVLAHHSAASLGFVVEESAHVNVWRNRLAERGLPVGPWLRDLKAAVAQGLPDDHPVRIYARAAEAATAPARPLGPLRREVVTVTPGQRIAYVTDVADTPENRAAIIALARDADTLFIEAAFAAEDAPLAAARGHLTTRAAGEIARAAGVRRVEPFHFSPRYEGQEERLTAEVARAFAGGG
jgi:ribonuclease Z